MVDTVLVLKTDVDTLRGYREGVPRLLEIFRELQEDSQLIVVTHQKRTMEIADSLYGVTMRNDGVTQVISQRLDG